MDAGIKAPKFIPTLLRVRDGPVHPTPDQTVHGHNIVLPEWNLPSIGFNVVQILLLAAFLETPTKFGSQKKCTQLPPAPGAHCPWHSAAMLKRAKKAIIFLSILKVFSRNFLCFLKS